MSEYTQEDLERAREHNRHQLPSGCYGKDRPYICRDCWADANLIASVRAEAQQARSSIVEDSLTEVIGDQANRYAARLAAAEKLAEAVVAYSVALTRERSFDPETKYQRERAWTLVEDSLNAFREAAK